MKISIQVSVLVVSALFFSACQTAVAPPAVSSTAPQVKQTPVESAEANLTQAEAQARADRLENIKYSLHVELDQTADTFKGLLNAEFDLKNANGDLFLDFKNGAKIQTLKINGQAVAEPSFASHRILLPASSLKAGSNSVEIGYVQSYSHNGRGLHRFVDPEDQNVYLYTQFEAFDAHQMFPCFDQPDLKATMSLTVTAPNAWQVISTTREVGVVSAGPLKTWTFPVTPKISTYLMSLHAGPFVHWDSKAGKIPLRLFARKTLAKFVKTRDWFTPTQAGLDFYGEYFHFPYPFKKFDEIIVPDFNAGAMENVAAITFTEAYIKRGDYTREERETIASVILHEMAHMWFGDLVTMKWWNGLWLNESFATFMSALSQFEATEFKESWVSLYRYQKLRAYSQDQLVITHPIEANVPDTNSAFSNFDAITYGKGASVLKQLSFYLGQGVFRDGVRYYFQKHAYGNTTLQDFIGALEHVSHKDLSDWSKTWLTQAGLDTVEARFECLNGRITSFALQLQGPDGKPSPREHKTRVTVYQRGTNRLTAARSADVVYSGPSTEIRSFAGQACPAMVDPNDEDFDYAKIRLDPLSLGVVKTEISEIPSPFTRLRFWPVLYQMVRDVALAPQEYLAAAERALSKEEDLQTVEQISEPLAQLLSYLPVTTAAEKKTHMDWAGKLESVLWARLAAARPGTDWQKILLQRLTEIAQTQEARNRLVDLLTGKAKLASFSLDTDRRWAMLVRLSALGDERAVPLIEEQKKSDTSERGIQMALAADAARPDFAVKHKWFADVLENGNLTYARARAALRSILPPWQDDLRAQLAKEYYERLPAFARSHELGMVGLFTHQFMPALCTTESASNLQKFIDANRDLPPSVIKDLRVGQQEDDRCVRIRKKFPL